jgi:hypothetical protein
MAFEIQSSKSINAGVDLRTKQYTFVRLDNTGRLASAGAGASAIGVLQDKPNLNDPGAVCGPGDITKIVCGGNIPAGADIMSDANGAAVVATSGSYILGANLYGAGVAGAVITMRFQPRGRM